MRRAPGRPEGLRYFLAFALAIALVIAAGSAAPFAAQTPAKAPTACDALGALKLQDVTITAATPVDAGAFRAPGAGPTAPAMNTPAFCRVAATLTPTPESHIKQRGQPARSRSHARERAGFRAAASRLEG